MTSYTQYAVQTSKTGLGSGEVADRVRRGEVNRVKPMTTRTISGILQNNILTVFNGVLAASVAALLFIGEYDDAFFLLVVTFINMLTGIIGELRAKWTLDKLVLLQRRTVTVIRDGYEQEIAAEAVVKDDLLVFGAGDQIVADGVLVASGPVFMDESLLTGEADTVMKRTGEQVLSGSFCVRGAGRYVVTHVGRTSNVNILVSQAKAYKFTQTPLQHSINIVIRMLTVAMIAFVLLLLLAGYVKNMSVEAGILSIVTVIKALVPEGLVLVSTLAFALGALRAARKHVLVQKLNAVESMSHLTTLCLDKTGTLGTNRLKFEKVEVLSSSAEDVSRKLGLLVGGVSDKNRTIRAIETAFSGIPAARIEELPFSSADKLSAVRVRDNGTEISLWLGAPEVLGDGSFTAEQQDMLKTYRGLGLRVLLFGGSSQPLSRRDDLMHLAFIILRDELRPDVAAAIRFYASRHVALKVLSGDHPETVAVLARQTGMAISGDIVNSQDLVRLSPADVAEAVHRGQIFGRVTPQQKQQIVQYLQISGEFVGMIGDGVNDILALKQADIGVAMNSGAPAARDVADIILLQDSFRDLPLLSQEGDRIIYNIKRVAQLFFTKNIYSLFFILFAGFIGLEFPLTPRYITWIDVLTIGMPAVLLTFMTPVVRQQSVRHFIRDTLGHAALYGLVIAFSSLVVYANFSLFQDRTRSYGKTAAVSAIILLALYIVYRVSTVEREKSSPWHRKIAVWLILFMGVVLNIVAVYWPPLRDALEMTSLDADSWLTIIFVSAAGVWIIHQIVKKRFLGSLLTA